MEENSIGIAKAPQRPFNERYSSRPSDLVSEDALVHASPTQATDAQGGGGEPLTPPSLPVQQPQQEQIIGGGAFPAQSVLVGAAGSVPRIAPRVPESVSDLTSPYNRHECEEDSTTYDNARVVYHLTQQHPVKPQPSGPSNAQEPGGDIDNSITTAPKKHNTKCITFCLITCTLILLGVSVCAAATMFILEKVLSNSELKTDTTPRPLEIQPGDTVLLYQGDASDLVVTEMVPPDEKRPNIQLYVVDCGKLMKHKKTHVVGSKSIDLRSNVSLPIPARYLHYELGSHFNFSVDIVDDSEHSHLTIFIFDNTTQANEYTKYQTTETRQQAIKYWSIPTNITNITTTLLFEATYGAYFVPVFSFETSGVLEIEFSYVITQDFYLHTDYIPYKYTNCSLMADEACSLDLKVSKNKTCVLAYNQASLETYHGPVVMQTVTETSEVVIPQYKHHLKTGGYVVIGFGVIALLLFFVILFYKVRRRIVKKQNQYVALDNYF